MWTKQAAKAYHAEWRANNREKWRGYAKLAREEEKLLKSSFPVAYRKTRFTRLYGDVAPGVTSNDVVWNVYCPFSGVKLDYGFRSGTRLDQAVLQVVNGKLQFVSLMSLPRGSRKNWRKALATEVQVAGMGLLVGFE